MIAIEQKDGGNGTCVQTAGAHGTIFSVQSHKCTDIGKLALTSLTRMRPKATL